MRTASETVTPAGAEAADTQAEPGFPLRLLDWRFFLPRPAPAPFQDLILLGGPPGMPARLVEEGVAVRVHTELRTPAAPADAVIALRGAAEDLRDLAAAVREGGILYCELDRRVRGWLRASPRRVERDLVDAGFRHPTIYAAVSDPVAFQAYVPLDAPGALPWVLKTLMLPFSLSRVLAERGALAVQSVMGLEPARLSPVLIATGVRGTDHRSPPALLQAAADFLEADPGELHALVLADNGNRLVMLPFATTSTAPLAVLKVPKRSAFNDRTVNESEMLTRLREKVGPSLAADLPVPLGRFRFSSIEVAVEKYLPGESLLRSIVRWGTPVERKTEGLHRAGEWLAQFHERTILAREPWSEAEARRWLIDPFREYEALFGFTPEEKRLAELGSRYALALEGVELPITLLHRDFNIWNVLLAGPDIRVIDWEGCRPGPALCDLIHFTTHWHENARRLADTPAKLAGFAELFFDHRDVHPAHRAARTALRNYLARLNMDARLLPVLLVYTWLELSLRRADQWRLQRVGGEIRAANSGVGYVGVLAANADRLFGATDYGSAFLNVPR